jgi:dienelactone hydrolase
LLSGLSGHVDLRLLLLWIDTFVPVSSCGGPGAVHANQGRQVHSVSSDTLVWLASGLDARCVKQCGLVGLCFGGRMTFDLSLSRAHTGVVVMR